MKIIFKDVTVFDGNKFFRGSLAVNGEIIEKVASEGEEIAFDPEKDEVVSGDYIVMPGMINLHTHIPMTLFKGASEDLPLEKWLNDRIFPLESKFISEEMVAIASQWGIAELLKCGVTAFSDMYFYEEKVAEAAQKANVRVFIGEAIFNFPTPAGKMPEDGIAYTEYLAEKYKDDPFVHVAAAPHSAYLCDEKYLLGMKEVADRYALPYHIHMAESRSEVETYAAAHGKTEFERFDELGLLDERFIGAHCVELTDRELDIMAKRQVTAVHCPSSNMKLGNGVARVTEMLEKGINVAVATDGSASNNNLDLMQEAELAAKLQKSARRDPVAFKAMEALRSITSCAGRPLGHGFGTISEGGKADLVLLSKNSYSLYPVYDPAASLLYSSNFSDIEAVYVGGRKVVEHGVVKTLNHDELRQNFAELVKKVTDFLKK